jgi:RNA polymerase sigma factor (sigma-70 family)
MEGMAYVAPASLARQLGSLFGDGTAAGLSDRELLERFIAGHDPADQAAFAAIVARHGPMVLGICRQFLDDRHHAEDAFQAVFLVLARQARSIRDPDLLGAWLYGVALRTARKAHGRLVRHRRTEEEVAVRRPEARPAEQPGRLLEREQAEALHVEIDRLPDAFRLPVVLCYFEGLSPDEAAERLRWPSGTLRSRLVRARDKLRRGLVRRGFALSTTGVAAAQAPHPASAPVSLLLCETTARAAIAFAAHRAANGALTAPAAALAQEVLRTMLIHKLKATTLSLLLLVAIATGAGYHSLNALAGSREGEPPGGPNVKTARTEPRPHESPRPHGVTDDRPPAAAGRMTVTGRVLGPDGQPAAGVAVDIIGTPRAPKADTDVDRAPYVVLGRGAADGDGRFRIEAARASSARFSAAYALAGSAGPGSGFGCVELNPAAEPIAAEVHLPPEQVIRGRLAAISGQPAAGVEVQLRVAYKPSSQIAGGRFDSPGYMWPAAPGGLRAWPKPITADAKGRFTVTGVGRGLDVVLSVSDPRFAQHDFRLEAANRGADKAVPLTLHPPRVLEGRVLAADTGQPIPDAVILVKCATSGPFGDLFTTRSRADGRGRFRINPHAGDEFEVSAVAPAGQPYIPGESDFVWPRPAVKKELDLTLHRGVLIRGQVTEQGTGRPVPGAGVKFIAMSQLGRKPVFSRTTISGDVTAREDGSFQVAVPPGKGYLLVLGPTLDYVPRPIAGSKLYGRKGDARSWRRYYAHDIIPYDVGPGAAPREVKATLKPARTLRGRVVGPEGQTVEDLVILTRNQIDPTDFGWRGWDSIHARDGRFELPGFDPETPSPAYFLDAAQEWGAAVELSGKHAGEELMIRLQPCGRAKARFVGPRGRPVARLNLLTYFQLLASPGATLRIFADESDPLPADQAHPIHFDPRHYLDSPVTGADGRVVLPDLIPGATYRISDWSTRGDHKRGVQLRKDFTVKPGETLDLGDILVEKPGA